jgi:hypothetical protein
MHARDIERAGWSELMLRFSVDWGLLSPAGVPDAIRSSVERRLAILWRFLDCSRIKEVLRWKGPCRSEEFEMNLDQWTVTYEIDLASGAAVVRRVVNHLG